MRQENLERCAKDPLYKGMLKGFSFEVYHANKKASGLSRRLRIYISLSPFNGEGDEKVIGISSMVL